MGRAVVVMGTDYEIKMLLMENFSNRKLGGEASKFLLKKRTSLFFNPMLLSAYRYLVSTRG